ncbi:MAG TPA: hypothetical protein VHF88_10750 [Thermoleophilaceae bacterium]|nr:hypothetical protein [Thermoleophilaceae bacterium]
MDVARMAIAALAVFVGSNAVWACADGDSSGEPTRVVIEVRDPSPARVALSAPRSVPAGTVTIELRNRGDTHHDAQLFRVDNGRTSAEVVGVLESSDSASKPGWLHPAGGVAATSPGDTATVTQILAPGTYYVADTQERAMANEARRTNATKGGIVRFVVEGEADAELPKTAATITASDDGYKTDGIVAGPNRVTFRNAGKELHQAVALPIDEELGYREGRRRALARHDDTGWVPVDVRHERATAVLEDGGEQIVELTFDPGRYVLLCFVSPRAGGAAQWQLGMSSELEARRR